MDSLHLNDLENYDMNYKYIIINIESTLDLPKHKEFEKESIKDIESGLDEKPIKYKNKFSWLFA